MIHSARGNAFLLCGVYCSLQQPCMWRFSFYYICNYRNEHTTVLRDDGLVQNFRRLFKVNWNFCKVSTHLLFPMLYAANTSSFSFFLFSEYMPKTTTWQLFNLWFLAQSLYLITIKLSSCINLFQRIRN